MVRSKYHFLKLGTFLPSMCVKVKVLLLALTVAAFANLIGTFVTRL